MWTLTKTLSSSLAAILFMAVETSFFYGRWWCLLYLTVCVLCGLVDCGGRTEGRRRRRREKVRVRARAREREGGGDKSKGRS